MGQSTSKTRCQIEDAMHSDAVNADDEKVLTETVNEFVAKHCEFGHGLYVDIMEMQSAICAYIGMVGLYNVYMRWVALYSYNIRYEGVVPLLFSKFCSAVNEKHNVYESGIRGNRVLVGVRISSWPHCHEASNENESPSPNLHVTSMLQQPCASKVLALNLCSFPIAA